MQEPISEKEEIEWLHCNGCVRNTKHKLIAEHTDTYSEPYYEEIDGVERRCEMWWTTEYKVFACCGCESVLLRKESSWSEDDYFGEVEYYPPPISRRLPTWLNELPFDMRGLLKEVYAAIHSDSKRLALMGARALLDMFIVEKVGDVGTFKQKLKAMEDCGYVSNKHREMLEVALEAGNAATHRGFNPEAGILNQVVDVVESVLQMYALEKASLTVKGAIPKRPPPPK